MVLFSAERVEKKYPPSCSIRIIKAKITAIKNSTRRFHISQVINHVVVIEAGNAEEGINILGR